MRPNRPPDDRAERTQFGPFEIWRPQEILGPEKRDALDLLGLATPATNPLRWRPVIEILAKRTQFPRRVGRTQLLTYRGYVPEEAPVDRAERGQDRNRSAAGDRPFLAKRTQFPRRV